MLAIVGTAAMLSVGGSIIVHSLAGMGWHQPEQLIETATSRIEQTLGFCPLRDQLAGHHVY
ncbi:DUF808 family protein [Agrobacterium pusense]|uniref:DUF808 family protein n=2 Tax=Agrobacterium pusense TaxID=648995 RepID=UPI0018E50BBB